MKQIPLTQGKVAIVDDEDYPLLSQHNWAFGKAGMHDPDAGYAMRTDCSSRPYKTILMHRVILGLTDRNVKADHRDGNTLNNRRGNLRASTQSQNSANKPKYAFGSSSRFKGVSFWKSQKRWIAEIYVGTRRIYLGYFMNEEDAARAYDQAAEKHYGEFAYKNFR